MKSNNIGALYREGKTGTWHRCTCQRINYRRKYWLFGKLIYDEVRDHYCPVHASYKTIVKELKS